MTGTKMSILFQQRGWLSAGNTSHIKVFQMIFLRNNHSTIDADDDAPYRTAYLLWRHCGAMSQRSFIVGMAQLLQQPYFYRRPRVPCCWHFDGWPLCLKVGFLPFKFPAISLSKRVSRGLTLWTPSNFLPNSCWRRLHFSHTTPRSQLIFRKTSPGARRFFESEKRRDPSRAFIPLTK